MFSSLLAIKHKVSTMRIRRFVLILVRSLSPEPTEVTWELTFLKALLKKARRSGRSIMLFARTCTMSDELS